MTVGATGPATDATSLITDAISSYFETQGSVNLSGVFGVVSGASSYYATAFEENPVEAAAAVTIGLFAVAALGPTATVATAVETTALYLDTYLIPYVPALAGYSTQMATALVNAAIGKYGESVYTSLVSVTNSIVSSLGGSLSSITVPASTGLPTVGSTVNPNIIITSAPDSSGNTPETLINLPVPAQDSSSVAVVSASNSALAPGTPTYQTDAYTGSTITFTTGGQQYQATVLYADTNTPGNPFYYYNDAHLIGPPSGAPVYAIGGIASTNVTSITTPLSASIEVLSSQITLNSDGSQTNNEFGSNGSVQYTQATTTQSNGSVSANVTGQGDIVNLSDASVALATGTQAAIAGVDNALSAAANVALSISGSGNTVTNSTTPTSATDTTITEQGTMEVTMVSYTTVGYMIGASGTVTGNDNTVTGSNGASIGFSGNGDTISASTNMLNIAQGSSSDAVTGNNDTLILGTGVSATAVGNNNSIGFNGDPSGGAGINFGMQGTGNSIALSNDLINIAQGSSGDALTGSGNTLILGTGVSATAVGNNNSVGFNGDPNGGAGISYGMQGTGDSIALSNDTVNIAQGSSGDALTGSGDTMILGTGVSATAVGNDNSIGFNGDPNGGAGISYGMQGTGDSIDLSHDSINIAEGSSGDAVTGNNDTLILGTGVGATIVGNDESVGFNGDPNGGAGIDFGTVGVGDTIALSHDTINTAEGSSGNTVTGSNDTVQVGTGVDTKITGNDDAAVFNGDPNGGNGMGLTLNGVSDSVALSGTSSTAVLNGSSGLVNDYGTTDTNTLNVSSDVAVLYGNSNTVNAVAANINVSALGQLENILGSHIFVDLTSTADASATGSSNTINESGSGAVINVSGNYDIINASNATITLQASNQHEVINGSNDVVDAGEYDQISFVGNDDVTHGDYDVVTGDGTGDYTDGDYDTDDGDEGDDGDDGDGGDGGDGDGISRVSRASGSPTKIAAAGTVAQTPVTSTSLSNTSIASGTTHSVADGTTTDISGTITNSGNLALASTGDATSLTVAGSATLSGNGHVTLSDNAKNIITGAASESTLTNNDALSGAGQIGLGDGNLALVNNSGGTIDATGTNNALTLNTGKTAIANSGLLEASGAAGLVVDSVVTNNSSGSIEAVNSSVTIFNNVVNNGTILVNGGDLDINGNATGAGTATITGTNAILEFGGTSNQAVTFASAANDTLKLDNALDFTGTVAGMASGDSIDLGNFLFSSHPTVSSVTGTGAAGTATDVNITNGYYNTTLALLNQYANQFAVSSSAYTLTADSATSPTAGTLLQLAAGHA